MTQATASAIAPLIEAVARTHDGRSHRYCRARALDALIRAGTTPTIAAATVAAAARVGEAIREAASKGLRR